MPSISSSTRRTARPATGRVAPLGCSLTIQSSPLSLRYRARNLVEAPRRHRRRDLVCRALNVTVAAIGLIVASPVMLIIAVAIKTTSRGPVIFRQRRVGLDRRRSVGPDVPNRRRCSDRGGRIFTMYKFRTMRMTAGSGAARWASMNDPRVTLVGRLLRATRLDELPQFINVLKGDMNIVGPRPEQPEIFAELQCELGRRYMRRQKVLPGITGLAQVQQGYDQDLAGVMRKVDLDLEYIGGRSAARDLQIMAKTLPVMVFRKVWM